MSIVERMEKVLQSVTTGRIDYLTKIYGYPCQIYKAKTNVYSDVYGRESGEEFSHPINATLLVTGDTFSPIDSYSAGTLSEGWIYTNDEDLTIGDRVDIKRADGRTRRYKVDSVYSLGTYTSVVQRFRIVALGD